MVGPMLTEARRAGVPVDDVVVEALEEPELRAVVLQSFAREVGPLDPLAELVVAALREGDAIFLEGLCTVDTVTPLLQTLLAHRLREVRAIAAVAFGEGLRHGPALPEHLRTEWGAALLGANPKKLPRHSRWRLGKILEHTFQNDPDLGADWLIVNAGSFDRSFSATKSGSPSLKIVRLLPGEQKRRVCDALPADTLTRIGLARELLGGDDGIAAELLAEGVVDVDLLLKSLSGHRDHTVEALAPVLLAAKVDPRTIADRTLWARESTGAVVDSIRQDLVFFAELCERRPELSEVCEAAARQLQGELDSAVAKERMDRLDGW